MKTKIALVLLSAVVIVSLSALVSKKDISTAKKERQSYQSSGQTMTDRNQFD